MNLLNKKFLIFLISVTLTNQALARTIVLEVGERAPFKGYLLDPETAKEVADDLIRFGACKNTVSSLLESVDTCRRTAELATSQKDILMKQNMDLAKQVQDNKDFNNTKKLIWAGIGAAVLGASVYLAGQLGK